MDKITEKGYLGRYKTGDKITIAGQYKKRTLLQWLMRRDKEFEIFTVINNV